MSRDLLNSQTSMPTAESVLTPAMRQYVEFKKQYPEYVLFFRMGDFYEMFWEDARIAHRVLGVTLTTRSRDSADPVPMAGVPFHAVESYLRKMIKAGHRVAICEQTEDASAAKGIIRREVTRLMSAGTLTDEPLLDGRSENFLLTIAFGISRGDTFRTAIAWVDLSTGSLTAMSDMESRVLDEIARLSPSEVLIPELPSGQPHPIGATVKSLGVQMVTVRPGWQFSAHHAGEVIRDQWGARSTEGFGFAPDDPANAAIGALLAYLQETQKSQLTHLQTPRKHVADDFLSIDSASYRSLEIDRTLRDGSADGSLMGAITRTRTAMGARLLRQWTRFPLCDIEHIKARQDGIGGLCARPKELGELVATFDKICDIERIITRVTVGRANPRDVASLAGCLQAVPELVERLAKFETVVEVVPELPAALAFVNEQATLLSAAIAPDPPSHLREGGFIGAGFDAELDRLRNISDGGKVWLADYQSALSATSGVSTVKVGYNRVFGYYIEVSESQKDKVPPDWTRKQTLKGAERYVTAELKTFEAEALTARDAALSLEQRLFEELRQRILPFVPQYQELAATIARLDVLSSLAALAIERNYCRPSVVESRVLQIIDGRHPVLEQQLGNNFVSNDTRMTESDALQLITGPNMAGKSTFIRQVALITIMAQIGSFVPAKSATIGVCDRIFARIGASDALHAGQSTFMVEMTETANILNNATDRSLVVLDEIGRGTSTLDGLSLAWAICEQIAGSIRCRTLFATHYHELTELATRYENIRNLNVAVREWEEQVVFLHRIVDGGTDRSYGIHVARLAGVPKAVLDRAKTLLSQLAVHHQEQVKATRNLKRRDDWQMVLFADPSQEWIEQLRQLDVDKMSAADAVETLRRWRTELCT